MYCNDNNLNKYSYLYIFYEYYLFLDYITIIFVGRLKWKIYMHLLQLLRFNGVIKEKVNLNDYTYCS